MHGFRPSRWRNPALYYVTLGVGLLLFSLWMPWLSASRTARIEARAEELAGLLLLASIEVPPPQSLAEREHLLARFFMLAACRGAWIADLEPVEPPPPGAIVCLGSKHYLVQLCESPPAAHERFDPELPPALEVTAWPRTSTGPGHCVFFWPQNAERAYSRNLRQNYAGLGKLGNVPAPGTCHRRPGARSREHNTYVGFDNDRWVYY